MKSVQRRGWIIPIIMLALAALACDPPPVVGITCLYEQNGAIIAPEQNGAYKSIDGGITWQPSEPVNYFEVCKGPRADTVVDSAHPQVQYRFKEAISIERSDDGGQTWQREVDLSGTDSRVKYLMQTHGFMYEYRAGPLDGVIDPGTGNLIVAMGYEGVIVRTPEGIWRWYSVGEYYRTDMRMPTVLFSLLSVKIAAVLFLGMLFYTTIGVLAHRANVLIVAGVVLASCLFAWGAFLGVAIVGGIMLSPFGETGSALLSIVILAVVSSGPFLISWGAIKVFRLKSGISFISTGVGWTYGIPLYFGGLIFAEEMMTGNFGGYVVAIAFVWFSIICAFIAMKERYLLPRLMAGGAVASASLLPYFLWAIGAIAFEDLAFWLSVILAVIVVVIAIVLWKRLPVPDEPTRLLDHTPPYETLE